MELYFDWELDDAPKISDPDNVVWEEIKSFYQTRFKLLEERIDAEASEDEPAFIVLVPGNRGLEVHPVNISAENVEKLKDSISREDLAYLNTVILKKLDNNDSPDDPL